MKILFFGLYAVFFLWCFFYGGIWACAFGLLAAWPIYRVLTAIERNVPGVQTITSSIRRLTAIIVIGYGIFLSTLTGSATSLVLPGLGSIGVGAATGVAIGFGTWLVIGTIGVATGGGGLAIGAAAMALIGGGFGAAGGAAGGFGMQTLTYPLVTPWFWIPMIVVGIYLLFVKESKRE